MISQADIIRTLVNKNCTDESVMSTALSTNCTPAKLLEKLTEAERFDLALDVSMKLGLDTVPLWRTWAMRCLKSRNFHEARDKFKLCFQRLKPQSTRSSTGLVVSGLLSEILKELSRMQERFLSLTDEIEQIKKQDGPGPCDTVVTTVAIKSILDRPTIYNECMFYLKEYGTIRDHMRFYVQHSLWNLLIKILIDNRTLLKNNNLFITDVFLQSASTGRLNDLMSEFLKADPNLESTKQYFHMIYEYCTSQRRYNILNYIQQQIGDFVAAAESQINHHFLKKPARNYKELNNRIASLAEAIEYYKHYLKKLSDKKHTISMKNDLKRKDVVKNDLYSEMSYFNAELRISAIELQIDITKNFAINEISGCLSDIEPRDKSQDKMMRAEDRFPVTLFDRTDRRKTYLASLVLTYYDPSCSCYFSEKGLLLANRLIHKLQLNKLDVFKVAMRIILEDESCDILESTGLLLERLKESYEEDEKLITRQTHNHRHRPDSHLPLHGLLPSSLAAAGTTASSSTKLSKHQQQRQHQQVGLPSGAPVSHDNEKVSLKSDNSILSSTTTTSSSSLASSSCSVSLTKSVDVSSVRPQPRSSATTSGNTYSGRDGGDEVSCDEVKRQPDRPQAGVAVQAGSKRLNARQLDRQRKTSLPPSSVPSQALVRDQDPAAKISALLAGASLAPTVSATANVSPLSTPPSAPSQADLFPAPVGQRKSVTHKLVGIGGGGGGLVRQASAQKIDSISKLIPLASSGSSNNSNISLAQSFKSAQSLCDEVLRDSIKSCREPDYKMELAKLLSPKAKLELYIELGKLSNAQRLACSMNWPDYVRRIIEEAERLNQNHVKTVCQHWLAKHESQSSLVQQLAPQ